MTQTALIQVAADAVKNLTLSQLVYFALVVGVLTLVGMLRQGRGIRFSLVPTKPPSGARRRRRKSTKEKQRVQVQAQANEPRK